MRDPAFFEAQADLSERLADARRDADRYHEGFIAGYQGRPLPDGLPVDYLDGYLMGQQQEIVDHEAGKSGRGFKGVCDAFEPSTMGSPRTCARCWFTDDEHKVAPR